MAALFASATAFGADNTIHVSIVDGKQRAEFTLNGDLSCVLVDSAVKCAPVMIAAKQTRASLGTN